MAGTVRLSYPESATFSGDVITDTIRTTNTEGDGKAADGSTGIYPAYSNLGTNGNAASATTGWATGGVGTLTRITNDNKFGSAAFKLIHSGSGASAQGGGVTGAPLTQTTYAMVAWVKAANAQTIGKSVQVNMNETGGAFAQTSISSQNTVMTGEWQEVYTIGAMARSDRTGITQFVTILSAASGDEIHFGGVRCGPATVVVPYAHTAGSTASKTAGRIELATTGMNATSGWVALRVRPSWTTNAGSGAMKFRPTMPVTLWQWKADASNLITVTFDGGRIVVTRTSAGGTEYAYAPCVPTRSTSMTVIAQWTAGGVGVSIDGGSVKRSYETILSDEFTRADDASGLGTAPTGQVWGRTGTSLPRIASNRYTPNGAASGNGYATIDLGETPAIMGGITSYTAASQNTTMIAGIDTDWRIENCVHCQFNDTGVTLQYREAAGSFTGVTSHTYATALATDGTTYPIWLAFNGNVVSFMGADGVIVSATDSHFSALTGRYCIYETSSNGAGAFSRWESVYAYRHDAEWPGGGYIPTGLPATADVGSDAGSTGHYCGDVVDALAGSGVLSTTDTARLNALTSWAWGTLRGGRVGLLMPR